MGKRRSIAEARSNLPQLIREAEAGKVVELTRHGEGVAVLIGRKQYDQLMSGRRSFADAWADFVRDVDLRDLQIDPDEIFAGVRDDSSGRDPEL